MFVRHTTLHYTRVVRLLLSEFVRSMVTAAQKAAWTLPVDPAKTIALIEPFLVLLNDWRYASLSCMLQFFIAWSRVLCAGRDGSDLDG